MVAVHRACQAAEEDTAAMVSYSPISAKSVTHDHPQPRVAVVRTAVLTVNLASSVLPARILEACLLILPSHPRYHEVVLPAVAVPPAIQEVVG